MHSDRKPLDPYVLRCAVVCHIAVFSPAYARHILGSLLDPELNGIGNRFAHTVGSAESYEPAVALYRQDGIVVYRLPCAFFSVRADLQIAGNIRVSGRNDLRQLERYRLSECELVNRTHFSDLRCAGPYSIQVEVLVDIVELLARLQHSARSVSLGVPSDENELLSRCSIHRILDHVPEIRDSLPLCRDIPACILMIDDHAALCGDDSCSSVFTGFLDCESVA